MKWFLQMNTQLLTWKPMKRVKVGAEHRGWWGRRSRPGLVWERHAPSHQTVNRNVPHTGTATGTTSTHSSCPPVRGHPSPRPRSTQTVTQNTALLASLLVWCTDLCTESKSIDSFCLQVHQRSYTPHMLTCLYDLEVSGLLAGRVLPVCLCTFFFSYDSQASSLALLKAG